MKAMRVAGLELRWDNLTIGLENPLDAASKARAKKAWEGIQEIKKTGRARCLEEPCYWPRLPFIEPQNPNTPEAIDGLDAWAKKMKKADVLASFGIGGSYLGNRVLRDALLGPLWNEFPRDKRGDRPELRFANYHLDPLESRALVDLVRSKAADKKKLHVEGLVISKSGGTTETLGGILAFRNALSKIQGVTQGFTAITDPGSVLGALAKDVKGEIIPFPEGIGGRWSVLSVSGLATAAATGVNARALLIGAAQVARELEAAKGDVEKDPALLYALLHHLQSAKKGRNLGVFMPYSDRLKCISEWYVQLLAESLGKKKDRNGKEVNSGRTPIVAVGTTDMHAQTQLHQEGPKDKVVTTLDVKDWGPATEADRVPSEVLDHPAAKKLKGKTFADLNTIARESNEEALARDGRPSCAIVLDRIDAPTLGGLLYFLMATVAYEGELLDVCAYDQPGVEAYKSIMKARL